MKIKQISVSNLFGLFNHVIPLNTEERITVIHGPNGSGKTVLLRMIDGIFKSDFSVFRTIPFDEFRIDFTNGVGFGVEVVIRTEKETKNSNELRVFRQEQYAQKESFPLGLMKSSSEFGIRQSLRADRYLSDFIPELRRIDEITWRYLPTEENLFIRDILERFGNALPKEIQNILSKELEIPSWFFELRTVVKTHFIRTQRLLSQPDRRSRSNIEKVESRQENMPTVARYSRDLASKIRFNLAVYAERSQSLDRTFPYRLVEHITQRHQPSKSYEQIRVELAQLEEKRYRLMTAGLLDKEDRVQIPAIDERSQDVLTIYVADVSEKLDVFNDILSKIELFKRIIDERFLYKHIVIENKEEGFIFETPKGSSLSTEDLSSGEQHELILFYELLFNIHESSFILIDEPELSLHVAWQLKFLEDLQRVTDLANIDVLIATHSPQIIHDSWDLTVGLGGPVDE